MGVSKTATKLVTTRAAAKLVGIHPQTVYKWSRQGKIATYRIEGTPDSLFDKEEITSLLERGIIKKPRNVT